MKAPWKAAGIASIALNIPPRRVRSGPVLKHTTTIARLPQIRCWQDDGGAFILLPQVYTEDPMNPGILKSNLGMYRIQLSGQPIRTRQRGRSALPDPAGHRHPPYKCHRKVRAPSGQRFCRRAARPYVRRGYAPSRRPARSRFRWRAGRPPLPICTKKTASPYPPKPTFALRAPSIQARPCPKARSATTWDITAWRTNFPC